MSKKSDRQPERQRNFFELFEAATRAVYDLHETMDSQNLCPDALQKEAQFLGQMRDTVTSFEDKAMAQWCLDHLAHEYGLVEVLLEMRLSQEPTDKNVI